MTPSPRIPEPEGLNAEFHRRAAGGQLQFQRCDECGAFRHPPRHRCATCGSGSCSWTPLPHAGALFAWTVTHFPFDRGWADEVPYVTAVAELQSGVRVIGLLEGVEAEDLRLGLALGVQLRRLADEFALITFSRA